uniref:Transposase n=2 Tax=environmental samples TaxID=67798 RepID=D9MP59_9BACT|nr:transposase IS4 family protein [uncultured Nitrospirae bacterium MY2-1F]ADI87748.1 transposase [uncultured Nitrospirae bacterium MY3-11A]
MGHYNTIYNQLLQLIPRHQFEALTERYEANRYVKYFTCWQQFITMLYGQIRGKDSLRDIETSLKSQSHRWYHIGLKDIKRSTLSDANNRVDYRIYEELFYLLLQRCKEVTPKHKFKFKNPLYSLDATVISLCLSMFPWAKYRARKGALKLHYLYDHSGNLPSFIVVTDGRQHEMKVMKENDFPLVPDSIISMDRAYVDYKWLYSLHKSRVFFVTRAKRDIQYEIIGQHPVDRSKGLIFDLEIKLADSKNYPDKLRLIGFKDPETGKSLAFLTNNFTLDAYTITQIYKARWQIEIFFKWIKQNLKIKSFLGTSENAVLIQIWTAMCCYLLLAYIKYQTKYSYSMLDLSRILAETLFERFSLIDLLSSKYYYASKIRDPICQPSLF